MSESVRMGVVVKDRVTGLRGIITGKTEYINGCVQWLVKPPVDKDGKLVDGCWIDTIQLEVVGQGIAEPETDNTTKDHTMQINGPGGPSADAPSSSYRRS
ncbi:MAG: hypothetical protein WC919_00595 [Candidatus Paceibacterota bacterium]